MARVLHSQTPMMVCLCDRVCFPYPTQPQYPLQRTARVMGFWIGQIFHGILFFHCCQNVPALIVFHGVYFWVSAPVWCCLLFGMPWATIIPHGLILTCLWPMLLYRTSETQSVTLSKISEPHESPSECPSFCHRSLRTPFELLAATVPNKILNVQHRRTTDNWQGTVYNNCCLAFFWESRTLQQKPQQQQPQQSLRIMAKLRRLKKVTPPHFGVEVLRNYINYFPNPAIPP